MEFKGLDMREIKYMKCGHAANATTKTKGGETIDICVVCWGTRPEAMEEAESPNLTGRKARCHYCKKTVDSSLGLAFFEYRPNSDMDDYYCGCFGWD